MNPAREKVPHSSGENLTTEDLYKENFKAYYEHLSSIVGKPATLTPAIQEYIAREAELWANKGVDLSKSLIFEEDEELNPEGIKIVIHEHVPKTMAELTLKYYLEDIDEFYLFGQRPAVSDDYSVQITPLMDEPYIDLLAKPDIAKDA